jgi:hypothetical protein
MLGLAGCAPAADLRVPAYQGAPIAGRLLVVRAGPVVPTEAALAATRFPDAASLEAATWDAFQRGLSEVFTFTDVQSAPLPVTSALVPVFVSAQVVNEGRAENRWSRRTVFLPSAPVPATVADYVLVVDTVRVDRRLGTETGGLPRSSGVRAAQAALTVLVGPTVAIPQRGIRTTAPFALYRVGTAEPLMIGELSAFGIGPEGVAPASAWSRSTRFLAENLGVQGRIETR